MSISLSLGRLGFSSIPPLLILRVSYGYEQCLKCLYPGVSASSPPSLAQSGAHPRCLQTCAGGLSCVICSMVWWVCAITCWRVGNFPLVAGFAWTLHPIHSSMLWLSCSPHQRGSTHIPRTVYGRTAGVAEVVKVIVDGHISGLSSARWYSRRVAMFQRMLGGSTLAHTGSHGNGVDFRMVLITAEGSWVSTRWACELLVHTGSHGNGVDFRMVLTAEWSWVSTRWACELLVHTGAQYSATE